MKRAEIIAVGSELLLGEIVNTNASYISEQLSKYGVPVLYHQVVGDNAVRMRETFEIARRRSILSSSRVDSVRRRMMSQRRSFPTYSNVRLCEMRKRMRRFNVSSCHEID